MARNGRALHHSLISNKNIFFLIKLINFLLQLFSLAFVFFFISFVWNVPKLLILKVYIGNMFFCGNNKKQKLIGRPQFWKGMCRKVYWLLIDLLLKNLFTKWIMMCPAYHRHEKSDINIQRKFWRNIPRMTFWRWWWLYFEP